MTQTSGDIKIGKIASKGDVTLTASNGAIVNSVDSAVNMTGAADKISAWQTAGLINEKDSDNSATNAAQEEKAIRLEGLENLFKRWALKDDGTVDQELYSQFINNTADRTKLDDEQIIQMETYQTLKTSTDYGFSKNQLLYAVQESLFNPSAGITASISDPIITGKNITLNAKRLGKELEPVTYSDLSNIKTLEKLAGVKGGDVTINENGSITVKERSPITVAQLATQDKLNITTQGNTFISGTAGTKFNVNTPVNAGNNKVVLMTGNGIDANKGITAKDIELYAGAGDLNAKIISGTLIANALGNINITSEASLPIKNVTSSNDAIIKADGNIVASDKKSLIRATDVELTATNDIGTKSLPLTIYSEVMLLDAKHVYVYDGDPAGSEDGEDIDINGKGNGDSSNSGKGGGNNGGSSNSKNSNGSNNSPAQSSTTPTSSINEVAPVTSNREPLNTTSATNTANTIPTNNFTTRTISQLDKFSHSLNHNELLKTESVDDDISAENFAAINQLDFDNIFAPVNIVSADDLTANKTLITLPDKSLYILNAEGIDNENEPPLSLTQNKEHYILALALSKSATLSQKSGYVYETLANEWLDGMGYDEAAKQQIIKLSKNLSRDRLEPAL